MNLLRNEDGAALMTVLLLVAVMSAAMIATLDILGLYTRSAATKNQFYQAREYARAAEIVGANQAQRLASNRQVAALQDMMSTDNKVSFQIDGGEISGVLKEHTNCFNLASMVQINNAGGYEINQRSYDQYVRLLTKFGVGERQAMALAAALIDWQDSDERPMPLGAESFSYSQGEVPYRSANQPISQIEELRLIKGYTPALISALSQISCVDPLSMETFINVNTATAIHAPLIQAMLGLPLTEGNITSILEVRPQSGFDNIARFWDNNLLLNRLIDTGIRKQFLIQPKRYTLDIEVVYGDVIVRQESLIGINDDQSYHIISRKVGI